MENTFLTPEASRTKAVPFSEFIFNIIECVPGLRVNFTPFLGNNSSKDTGLFLGKWRIKEVIEFRFKNGIKLRFEKENFHLCINKLLNLTNSNSLWFIVDGR